MKGKITIDIPASGVYAFDVAIEKVSRTDKFLTVDSLVEALGFSEDERMELGLLIAIGGFKALHKNALAKVTLSDQLAELVRKRKGNEK